ncbi:putative TIM-barrel fold metal-dependent hydrolase [Sphingomonas jinjuensis]|uniref:Putative TIM-barrel fold metal-dependent hydrolase n=1 Tax=Sphingomonas jinjuensis TaxID=535907 RepID=A0A840F8S1_9SPHN|nr:amidohydrolase family protein [Sphingomonas jinjuensis]MBB4154370.1 putative TIM-barrel fold metal-dependent hydrolase [Sphingomonas jinjuensis]
MTRPFVDAHIHLWDLSRLRYPWLSPPFADDGPNGSVEPIARDFGVADYRAALARWNVAGAVHVDAGVHPDDALAETEWLEAQGDLPTGIVAFAALNAADIEAQLAAQAAHPRVRGIRHIVNWHPDPRRSYTPRDLTVDPQWQEGFAALARHGLSFDLQCYPGQMPGLVPTLAINPGVPVIINHLGMPVLSDADGVADWRRGMRTLAALPQVAVKISGLGFIKRDWQRDDVAPFVHEAIEMFGPRRCLMASDVPTDLLFAPIDRYMETLHALAGRYDEAEQDAMFAGNANRVYRLGL